MRQYDNEIGRFAGIDALSTEYASWSGYNSFMNSPIIVTDPTGMGPDTTRVYNKQGNFQFEIPDNEPNEDHFLNDNGLHLLNLLRNTNNSDQILSNITRNVSEFYIGNNTREQLKTLQKSTPNEEGFLLFPNGSGELVVQNAKEFQSSNSSNHFTFNTRLIPQFGYVSAGHTHNGSSSPSAHSIGFGISDYAPILNRKAQAHVNPHLLIIAGTNDFTIYSSARHKWTPTIVTPQKVILGSHRDYDFPGGEKPSTKINYYGIKKK